MKRPLSLLSVVLGAGVATVVFAQHHKPHRRMTGMQLDVISPNTQRMAILFSPRIFTSGFTSAHRSHQTY